MAQVITGLDNIPISAASAAYAPTNTADVTAMIDSAVSGKLDASASSSFQPVGNYVSSDDLSAYLPTSSIETSVDGITGIGGTAIAGGGTTYTAGQYIQISGDEISVTGLQPSGDYVSSSELADYQPTSSMSAYATTVDLSAKLDASASSSFITSTADCMPLSASSDYYSTSNPAGYITGVDLTPYQTTAGMSAYATTGDLSAKLDESASSSFITSTSDCMPLSSSSEYYSTSNPSGFVTSSYSPTLGYYNGNISSIDGTGLMGTDTAVVSTNTAQSFANIESGLPIDDTIIFDTPVTSIKITVPNEPGTEPWLNLNADNPDGNETVLAYSGTDSYYTYNTSLGGSGWTSISFYDTSYLIDGGIRGISATGYSDGVTSTAELMHLSASSNFYSTSNPAGYITGVDLTPYQTTADMSGYLATSSIGVDTADAITSIAGSAIAGGGGGGGMVTAIGTSESGITSINSTGLVDTAALRSADYSSLYVQEPLYISSTGDSSYIGISGDYVSSSELASYQTTAGMSAYLPTSAIGVDTASSLITGINGSALSAGSTYSAGQYVQISGDEISVTGLQPSGSYASSTDLSAYQQTAGMSAYATTGDLSAKLDVSASSSFLTAQEQASWSETASASPSYIVDKPDLVDIVAGPGIVVDNPDGNTLRVSQTDPTVDVVRDCENWNGHTMKCIILRGAYTTNTSMQNQYIENVLPVGTTIAFIDGSNSYVVYGGNPQLNMTVPYCIDYNRLFSPWVDITNRRVNLRYIDVSNNVTCTYYLCVKYAVD